MPWVLEDLQFCTSLYTGNQQGVLQHTAVYQSTPCTCMQACKPNFMNAVSLNQSYTILPCWTTPSRGLCIPCHHQTGAKDGQPDLQPSKICLSGSASMPISFFFWPTACVPTPANCNIAKALTLESVLQLELRSCMWRVPKVPNTSLHLHSVRQQTS